MIRIVPEAGVTGNGKPRASGDDPYVAQVIVDLDV